MKLDEIQSLIKFVSRSGVSEVELETEEFKLTIKSTPRKSRKKKGEQEEQTVVQQVPVSTPVAGMQPVAQPQPQPQQQPAQQPAQPQQGEPAAEKKGDDQQKDDEGDDSNYVTIKSPMIGTFYRSSEPDKPPYVNVDDKVKEGDVICIIEAMKLFNEIEAEVSGKIVKVLVDDATPVEYDQPLFLVDPSK